MTSSPAKRYRSLLTSIRFAEAWLERSESPHVGGVNGDMGPFPPCFLLRAQLRRFSVSAFRLLWLIVGQGQLVDITDSEGYQFRGAPYDEFMTN